MTVIHFYKIIVPLPAINARTHLIYPDISSLSHTHTHMERISWNAPVRPANIMHAAIVMHLNRFKYHNNELKIVIDTKR